MTKSTLRHALLHALVFVFALNSNSLAQDIGSGTAAITLGGDDPDTLERNATVFIDLDAAPPATVGSSRCSGTLIAPDIVLTAGHCFDPILAGGSPNVRVWPSSSLTDWENPNRWYPIFNRTPAGVQVYFGNKMSNFLASRDASHYRKPGFADMLLLKLDRPVPREAAIPAKPLLDTSGMSIDWSAQNFRMAGWGWFLGQGRNTINPTTRQRTFGSNGFIRETGPWPACTGNVCGCIPNKMCIRNMHRNSSLRQGDSGGPLYWTDPEGQEYVIGALQDDGEEYVVTFGKGGLDGNGRIGPKLGCERYLTRDSYCFLG